MTKDELLQRLRSGPLERLADDLVNAARSCVRLATEAVDVELVEIGQSRIGGVPDLPEGFVWPSWNGVPQSFLAQLRLEDLAASPLELPESGWLLFFYDAEQSTWGFDPKDRGSFGVHFVPPGAKLERVHNDAVPAHGRFVPCRIKPTTELSLPPWESPVLDRLRLAPSEMDAYFEILDGAEVMAHQVGGHPEQVQGDMTRELPMIAAGLFTGDASGWNDPRAESLQEQWSDWQLLLQVASDEGAGMMWGDVGYLYFWITKDALRAGDFSAAWLILQCH